MEKAFAGPAVIAERMGGRLDVAAVADADPEQFGAMCTRPPAIHRFPGAMAKRVQATCRVLVDHYDGNAANIWAGVASGARAAGSDRRAARFRRAEGGHLHGAAGQAVRRRAGRLAGGGRLLRRARQLPVGRRRRGSGLAAKGPRDEEGGQGRRAGGQGLTSAR